MDLGRFLTIPSCCRWENCTYIPSPRLNAQVSAADLHVFAGTSFTMVAQENVLSFRHIKNDVVELTINGSVTEELKGNVHLNLNPMACCIGEACIMWPEKPLGFKVSVNVKRVSNFSAPCSQQEVVF